MTRLATLLLATTILATPAAAALPPETSGQYVLDKSHANILFMVDHLGFSDYIGRFNSFDATLELDAADLAKSKVEATIAPVSVDTNNEELEGKLRGEHYFNADKFPEIKFVSKEIKVTGPESGTITGDLTLLGVTKPVTLDAKFEGQGVHPYSKADVVGFSATGALKRSEWGLDTLVPNVGDEVKLVIQAEFNKVKTEKEG